MLTSILAAALIAPSPSGQTIVAKDGDTVVYRTGALVRVVRRTEGNVRAIYNAPHRWLVLLVGNERVDTSLLYNDLDGTWPLGDRWEGAAVIEEYSVLGGPPRIGLGLTTPNGLVQLFQRAPVMSGVDWFRDPRAIAAVTFQDGNNRSSPARPTFDQAEREGIQFAEAVFKMQESRGQSPQPGDMNATINTTISVGGSKPQAFAGMQPVRVGSGIRTPRKVVDAKPDYPPIAQSARVQGVVILEITVDTDGNVTNPKILRSIPLLDQAAIDCVKQWKFEPTQVNGVNVPVIMTVTVNFALQ